MKAVHQPTGVVSECFAKINLSDAGKQVARTPRGWVGRADLSTGAGQCWPVTAKNRTHIARARWSGPQKHALTRHLALCPRQDSNLLTQDLLSRVHNRYFDAHTGPMDSTCAPPSGPAPGGPPWPLGLGPRRKSPEFSKARRQCGDRATTTNHARRLIAAPLYRQAGPAATR